MAIRKRMGVLSLHLKDLLSVESSEGGFQTLLNDLKESDPVLEYKRMSGRDFDLISRRLLKCQIEVSKMNREFQQNNAELAYIKDDPDSLQLYIEVFQEAFMMTFISLTGYEDEEGNHYTEADKAFEAIFDHFPALVLPLGKHIIESQVPSGPES